MGKIQVIKHEAQISSKGYLMYASGKALVALAISARTWLGSLQPNMGSLYIDQYLE